MTGRMVSLLYQPPAMRWRGVSVLTNTPPRRAQSQPGGMQGIVADRADPGEGGAQARASIRWRSAASTRRKARRSSGRPTRRGERATRPARSSRRRSTAARETLPLGRAQGAGRQAPGLEGARRTAWRSSAFVAGSTGFDGLFVIKPDGRMYIQSGIGNLGTESMSDCHRVAAEMIGMPWEKVEHHLGRHGQEPAVELRVRRQPDDARA